jgi:pimeloyl-ACP methyl ester carboxylesterase
MGGFVTIATAALHADRLDGVIICDSPVTQPDPEVEQFRLRKAFGVPRTYANAEEAIARFRTVPPQANYLDYVMANVAAHSLKPVEGGVKWKYDPQIFQQFARGMRGIARPYLHQIRCRLALLRSEHGLVTETIGQFMFESMGRVTPVIELPQAGHHAMLDEPLVLLTAIRTLLADWDHSEPHQPHTPQA